MRTIYWRLKFKDFSRTFNTFKHLICFQGLSRALNIFFKIQAFSRISQACYKPWITHINSHMAKSTLRLRLLSSWNGRIQFCCLSHATASLSITADVTDCSVMPLIIVCIRRTMSGYLLVLSSWLRLNTLTLPSSNTWIYTHTWSDVLLLSISV